MHIAAFRNRVMDHGIWVAVSDTLSVSSLGYVKTYCRNHGHRIYQPATDNGHGYIVFKHDGVSRRFNRVVCEAFHGPPPSADAVADHINRVRSDNRAANLRWASKADNATNCTSVQRRRIADVSECQDPILGETWKTVGRFRVSNMGRAQVMKTRRSDPNLADSWHPIFTPKATEVCPYARLGKQLFHSVVAAAFLGPPPFRGASVDHIDNQSTHDNRVSNLRWATKKQQIANRTIKKKASCLSTPVFAYSYDRSEREVFAGFADAARQLRERLGMPFHHVNVARAARANKTYNGVRFGLL